MALTALDKGFPTVRYQWRLISCGKVRDVPFRSEFFRIWLLHHHLQIQSNQVRPECMGQVQRQPGHGHVRPCSGTGRQVRSSVPEAARLLCLPTTEKIQKSLIRKTDNNPGRNDW